MKEYLITAQGYHKNDPDKQEILLHDTILSKQEDVARIQLLDKLKTEYNITKVFSVIALC